jgi:hypothetical protein
MIAARRLRRDYFTVVRGDPAWSIMLELYAARIEGRAVPEAMIGPAAGIPQRTAAEAARRLLRRGILEARPDGEAEPAPRLLALTDPAAERMADYLTAMLRIAPFIP